MHVLLRRKLQAVGVGKWGGASAAGGGSRAGQATQAVRAAGKHHHLDLLGWW